MGGIDENEKVDVTFDELEEFSPNEVKIPKSSLQPNLPNSSIKLQDLNTTAQGRNISS